MAAPGCQGFRLGLGVVEVDLLVLHAITHKVLGFVGFVLRGHMSRRTEHAAKSGGIYPKLYYHTPTASTDIILGFHAASRGGDGEYFPNCAKQASALLPQLALMWPGTSSRTTWHSICLLNHFYNCRAKLIGVWPIQEKVSLLWYLKF